MSTKVKKHKKPIETIEDFGIRMFHLVHDYNEIIETVEDEEMKQGYRENMINMVLIMNEYILLKSIY